MARGFFVLVSKTAWAKQENPIPVSISVIRWVGGAASVKKEPRASSFTGSEFRTLFDKIDEMRGSCGTSMIGPEIKIKGNEVNTRDQRN